MLKLEIELPEYKGLGSKIKEAMERVTGAPFAYTEFMLDGVARHVTERLGVADYDRLLKVRLGDIHGPTEDGWIAPDFDLYNGVGEPKVFQCGLRIPKPEGVFDEAELLRRLLGDGKPYEFLTMLESFCHELVHYQQMVTGVLSYKQGTKVCKSCNEVHPEGTYHGTPIADLKLKYQDRPWEQEAFAKQNELLTYALKKMTDEPRDQMAVFAARDKIKNERKEPVRETEPELAHAGA